MHLFKPEAKIAPKLIVICARILSTLTTTNEPFFGQAILHFMLTWKADSSRKMPFFYKIHVDSFSHLWIQSGRLLIFSSLFLSWGWNWAFLKDRLWWFRIESCAVRLDTLSPVKTYLSCSITCSKAADRFLSMPSNIGFLRRSLRRRGRSVFRHFSKILSGSLSSCFSHLCAVRTWISSCLQLQRHPDTSQTITWRISLYPHLFIAYNYV